MKDLNQLKLHEEKLKERLEEVQKTSNGKIIMKKLLHKRINALDGIV